MSKTEKILGTDTIGGRIQHIRLINNLDKIKFHEIVKPNDNIYDESKEKNVTNWQNSKTTIPTDVLIGICNAFNCSADYILGLQNEKNHDINYICQETSLNETSVEVLQQCKNNVFNRRITEPINYLVSTDIGRQILQTFYYSILNITPIDDPDYTLDRIDKKVIALEKVKNRVLDAYEDIRDCGGAYTTNTKLKNEPFMTF